MVDTILVTGVPELLEAELYDNFPKSRKRWLELQFTLQIKLILKQIVNQRIEFVNLDYLE